MDYIKTIKGQRINWEGDRLHSDTVFTHIQECRNRGEFDEYNKAYQKWLEDMKLAIAKKHESRL